MQNSRLNISFLIIVALGVLIAFMSYAFLSSTKVNIYVFKDNYRAGTQITESMLAVQQVDASTVRNTAVDGASYVTQANVKDVLGSYLVTDVVKGMPVLTSYTDKFGGSPPEMRLSPNHVAVTIPSDNITGVNPFITAGARVNIYAGFNTNSSPVEYLLLQNIKVLDAQYAEVENASTKTPILSGITVEVTPEQSLKLQYACEWGKVRLALVKQGQYTEVTLPPYTINEAVAQQQNGNK